MQDICCLYKDSYEQVLRNIKRTNLLEWINVRHSAPSELKSLRYDDLNATDIHLPFFKINNQDVFDITKK